MADAKKALNSQNTALLNYLQTGEESYISGFSGQNTLFEQACAREKSNVTEENEENIVNTIQNDYAVWAQNLSILLSRSGREGHDAALRYYRSSMQPQYEAVSAGLEKITQINQNAMLAKKSAAAENARNSLYLIIFVSLLAVVSGFLLSRHYVNRFLQQVHLLTENISKVSAGKLSERLEVHTGDELEKLVSEFNGMMDRLSAYEQSTVGNLMEEKNKTVSIVRSIPDPLVVLDNNYRFVMVNKACERHFHFEGEKAIGKHFLEVIRDGELFRLITAGAESTETVSEKVLSWEADEKEKQYFNIMVTKIGHAGSVRGCIVLMQNVTEFKELERVKTEFIATVSHEFKTPLTSIIMGASMLEGGNLGLLEPRQKNVVDAIIEDGERLSGFVNELLEVSRLESGKAIYSFEPCSVAAVAQASIRQFLDTARRKNVSIVNDISDDLPPVCADFERITWVFNNLINNALKNTASGDFITVGAEPENKFMKVFVKDTGNGIPPEYLERIFDKFVQVKGQDGETHGTGLGLSVVKEIITAHGGTITVESELDAGSIFRFTLPIAGRNRRGEK